MHPVVMVDRSVFWAELGLVSPPALLVRIGGLLEECAAQDEELSKAMHLAARHVQQECLVWAPYSAGVPHDAAVPKGMLFTSSQDQDGKPKVTSETAQLVKEHGQVEPINALRAISIDDVWSVDSGGSISSDCSGDDQPRHNPCLMSKIFTQHSLIDLLPGVGQGPCHVVWFVVMTVVSVLTLCMASLPSQMRMHLGWISVWGDLRRVQYLMFSLAAFYCLPMMRVLGRLRRSEAWHRALLAELDSDSGEELRRFLPTAVAVAALVFVAHLPHCLLARGSGLMMFLDIVTKLLSSFVHAVWNTAFLLLWRLSSNGVIRLQDRTLSAARSGRSWALLTRDYQDFGQLLYGLWTQTGVSLLSFAVLMLRLALLCWTMGLQIANPNYSLMSLHLYVTICDATLLCTGLYLMADISSRINSNRHSTRSLLNTALKWSGGNAPSQEVLEHLRFVHCIQLTRCGIEVQFIGKVSMSKVAPLVRIIAAAIPACFGTALRLAHEQAK